jgi:hypothetical protein
MRVRQGRWLASFLTVLAAVVPAGCGSGGSGEELVTAPSIPPPSPSPTPSLTFNGTYTGSADGSDQLTLTVANGVVSVTVGSDVIPGTVSAIGAIAASGGNCTSTLTGQITITASVGATAAGTWSHPTSVRCGTANSGSWTAIRLST